jgi:hypothetical protein
MKMGGSFTYQSLDSSLELRQIRFLKVLPAEHFADETHCTIFHSSLKTPPVYEAVLMSGAARKTSYP